MASSPPLAVPSYTQPGYNIHDINASYHWIKHNTDLKPYVQIDNYMYHFVVDLVKVNLTHLIHHIFTLKRDKCKSCKTYEKTRFADMKFNQQVNNN